MPVVPGSCQKAGKSFQDSPGWKGKKKWEGSKWVFCYHTLVREISPISHIKNVHLSVTSYMQQTRLIFFCLEISFVMCVGFISQPFLRHSWQLCPHCPGDGWQQKQHKAAGLAAHRSQDFLLFSSFLFLIYICCAERQSPGSPFKEASPQHPGDFPEFTDTTYTQNTIKIYQNCSVSLLRLLQ